jgi:uncharacterized protein (DUF305 family)
VQQYEAGRMELRLNQLGGSRAERPDTAMAWMGMPVPVAAMPGLATEEQLAALGAAQGAAADAAFLDVMAEHHRGGVHMAEHAAAHSDDEEVRTLAARMARSQGGEINEYRSTALRLGLPVEIDPYVVGADPFARR